MQASDLFIGFFRQRAFSTDPGWNPSIQQTDAASIWMCYCPNTALPYWTMPCYERGGFNTSRSLVSVVWKWEWVKGVRARVVISLTSWPLFGSSLKFVLTEKQEMVCWTRPDYVTVFYCFWFIIKKENVTTTCLSHSKIRWLTKVTLGCLFPASQKRWKKKVHL